ncbi:hypothetical protein PCASD_08352 [Puccinia coronata f. sp. avenae]|uniref:Uncharacterized protein n=1 Tax=Puccinia coronata f. sp. avenae TaxID=200324 RepID=A0A2N5USE9_9BASI|nr:hypothetical protein PCASD_08352 [Puccinia coronata f. sp. avenae]
MRLKLAALLTLYTKRADSADIAARPTHPVRERLGRGPTHRLENQGVDVALEYAFVQVQSNYIQNSHQGALLNPDRTPAPASGPAEADRPGTRRVPAHLSAEGPPLPTGRAG